jgi:hypothetical protein
VLGYLKIPLQLQRLRITECDVKICVEQPRICNILADSDDNDEEAQPK